MIITFECDAYEIEERIEELNELGGGGELFPIRTEIMFDVMLIMIINT